MIKEIYWYICKVPKNMGDLISPYLFEKMTGEKAMRVSPGNGKPFFLSCCSILNACNGNAIVWGTGSMFSNAGIKKPLKILSVRGPLTRGVLIKRGIQCPEVYGDPGLLLPNYYAPKPHGHYRVGIIPHYADYESTCKRFSGISDILVIDIGRGVEPVCDDISSCDITVSSSLHGIIVSHAYGVPCAWMTVSPTSKWPIGGGHFKYNDYYLSRGMNGMVPIPWGTLPQNVDSLYKLLKKYPQPTESIDTEKLISTCPFGKTLDQILQL